jgi:hypothetical protein
VVEVQGLEGDVRSFEGKVQLSRNPQGPPNFPFLSITCPCSALKIIIIILYTPYIATNSQPGHRVLSPERYSPSCLTNCGLPGLEILAAHHGALEIRDQLGVSKPVKMHVAMHLRCVPGNLQA